MAWAARRGRRGAALAAALLLAIAAALALAEGAGWPGIGRVVHSMLTRASGSAVVADDCRARLLFGRWLTCNRITIGAEPWLDANQVRVQLRWADLWRAWRGEGLRLRSLEAQALQLHLRRDAQGRANWRRPGADDSASGDGAPPRVETLRVGEGRLRWEDVPRRVNLDATVQSADAAAGGWRARIEGRWRDLDLSLNASSPAPLPLLQAQPAAGTQALQALKLQGTAGAARVSFDGRAAALLGARELDGALVVAGPSLARVAEPFGLTLPQTPPFELRGQLSHGEGLWRLAGATARIGRSRLGGEFSYETQRSPPRLIGNLRGEQLLLADLGPSIGVGAAPAAAAGRRGVLPDRAFDLPSLRSMQADLGVDLAKVDLNTSAVRPLEGLRARLLLRDGVLLVQDIDAGVAGGRLRGDSRLETRGEVAQWAARLRFAGVDVARWFPAVRRESPGEAAYLTGTLDADVDVRGVGRSTKQILSSLDGQAQLRIRDGTLSHLMTEAVGLDVAQALGVLARGDRALPLRCAFIRIRMRDGVGELGPALVDNRDSTLRIAGQISLAEETLALVVRSRPKDASPLSLRSPVTVSGPWSDPLVGIDGRSLAGRALGAALLGATLGPAAALLALFDKGDKPTEDPCAATTPAVPPR